MPRNTASFSHTAGYTAHDTPQTIAGIIGLGAEQLPSHDASDYDRRQRLKAEEKRLRIWARENGRLKDALPPEDARGGEHAVAFDEPTQRIVRFTHPETRLGYGLAYGSYLQGATPSEYLDRWAIHNHVFGDDVRLECVVARAGVLRVVTSQPFIRGRDATDAEIRGFMVDRDFEHIGPGAFYHWARGLLVDDLFPRNAKVSARGVVLPIDGVVQRVGPAFAKFLRDEYFIAIPAERPGSPCWPASMDNEPERKARPRKPKGVKLEADAAIRSQWPGGRGVALWRERLDQPQVSRGAALRQISATIPLSEAARAELS